MLETHLPLAAFLQPTPYLDHEDARIRALIDARGWRAPSPAVAARAAFEFVRDEISHSWDVRSHRITRSASDALVHGEGLCYAKAHLLTAILRQLGVPSGLAYQRLTFGDTPESGYTTHGLSTVFLAGRWLRIDARGNKPGVDAQFPRGAGADEQLAFVVRPEMDERDYGENFSDVHPTVARALEGDEDLHVLIERLPSTL